MRAIGNFGGTSLGFWNARRESAPEFITRRYFTASNLGTTIPDSVPLAFNGVEAILSPNGSRVYFNIGNRVYYRPMATAYEPETLGDEAEVVLPEALAFPNRAVVNDFKTIDGVHYCVIGARVYILATAGEIETASSIAWDGYNMPGNFFSIITDGTLAKSYLAGYNSTAPAGIKYKPLNDPDGTLLPLSFGANAPAPSWDLHPYGRVLSSQGNKIIISHWVIDAFGASGIASIRQYTYSISDTGYITCNTLDGGIEIFLDDPDIANSLVDNLPGIFPINISFSGNVLFFQSFDSGYYQIQLTTAGDITGGATYNARQRLDKESIRSFIDPFVGDASRNRGQVLTTIDISSSSRHSLRVNHNVLADLTFNYEYESTIYSWQIGADPTSATEEELIFLEFTEPNAITDEITYFTLNSVGVNSPDLTLEIAQTLTHSNLIIFIEGADHPLDLNDVSEQIAIETTDPDYNAHAQIHTNLDMSRFIEHREQGEYVAIFFGKQLATLDNILTDPENSNWTAEQQSDSLYFCDVKFQRQDDGTYQIYQILYHRHVDEIERTDTLPDSSDGGAGGASDMSGSGTMDGTDETMDDSATGQG